MAGAVRDTEPYRELIMETARVQVVAHAGVSAARATAPLPL